MNFGVKISQIYNYKTSKKLKISVMDGRGLLRTVSLRRFDTGLTFSEFLITIFHVCVNLTSVDALDGTSLKLIVFRAQLNMLLLPY